MEVRSQFSDRYKKDRSVENLRAKVARRKSITQKENRQKEFKKSRGQSLADVIEEQEQPVVGEVDESCHVKGPESKPANQESTKEQPVKDERRALLERYKEEKQLRKLKEQRENAQKIFKCGKYRPEQFPIPIFTARTGAKEKPPAPCTTRVTRSAAKTALPNHGTHAQANPVNVVTSKATKGAIPKVRGQTSVIKKDEKESKVSIPSSRTTRSSANAPSKITTAGNAPPKRTAAIKPQKTTKETSPEKVIAKSEPPVAEHTTEKVPALEPIQQDSCVESVPEILPVSHERLPSFAPENFVFQPLDGLSSFHLLPMTPDTANAFLSPTFTWTPIDDTRNVFSDGDIAPDPFLEQVPLPDFPSEPSPFCPDGTQNVNASPQDNECVSDASSAPQTSPALTPPPCEPSTEAIPAQEPLHDVPYFRGILKSELEKLTLLCNTWNKRIETDIPDDAKDQIRTTVGQTNLLMTERFKQFEGLVDNCEFKKGDKETTCTDLAGFWDMIYFQIEDVSKKFFNLGILEENSWQQDTVQTKTVKKKIAPAVTAKPNQGDAGRAAAKSRLAAVKAAMKNKLKPEDPISDVEAPVIPTQEDPIVFDAGFFRIESPAKLPGSLRKNRSSLLPTPKSVKKLCQNSGTPRINCVEDAAEEMKPAKSLSPAKSPRKVLFGNAEESLQNQEADPVVPTLEHAEADSTPSVDMTKYLAPTHAVCLGAVESPGLLQCSGLETTQDGLDSETTMMSDVFMCSPERDVHAQTPSLPETSNHDDVKTTSEPLDLLGSCSPMTVQYSPMSVDFAAPADLIMFSPMEK